MNASMNLPMPSAAGGLEGYVQAVNRFPVLTHEQELELATRFRQQNDLEAARQLVLSHLRVVVSVARGYTGYGLPQADLIQEGNIGLMKAVKRYDPERGVRLVSFALHWIRAEIHEFVIRNWRMVKIATTKSQRKLFFNLRSLKKGLEPLRPQQVSEIAQQLNVSEHDVVEMEARFAGHELSLDPMSGNDEDESYSPVQYLADDEAHEPSVILETSEREHLQSAGLANALSALDERSRRIVEARWLTEDSSATLHELADEFGVSAERIRQIEQKAFSKMGGLLAQT
ncbi:MAG: RNA polymerase sigma factor RpoH [Gammaproteobacteria bacterium]|nr:RNA polymerase sigma factor RpoH [Sideroxydans sp.]MBU1214110.1 RNA polymerase sigma factor RpoH [Gammaproteobacteria bacterium]MBU1447491.1 RNA polymerase sigma factor RpoH [Gammaproteobacteria bacterium]MBU3904167.1 RNA polymerase sigma factor RpoH [Gammaproteobacteria bacterium]MBU4046051.1 RNA polymerase sigma factor RpoH [Gammaproteobacteria bacterium]